MQSDIERILIHADDIRRRVGELAEQVAALYDDKVGVTIVPILSGSIIFLADLIRQMPQKQIRIALLQVSSYREQDRPGESRILINLTGEVTGRHVLIVDDILDSGGTLSRVQKMIREQKPASMRTMVLVRKPGKASPEIFVDFVGFDIEDLFVVGYGLDYAGLYRNYPHIGVVRTDGGKKS